VTGSLPRLNPTNLFGLDILLVVEKSQIKSTKHTQQISRIKYSKSKVVRSENRKLTDRVKWEAVPINYNFSLPRCSIVRFELFEFYTKKEVIYFSGFLIFYLWRLSYLVLADLRVESGTAVFDRSGFSYSQKDC